MPFRFRKIFKLAPGMRINMSKSGFSTSFGKPGASLNLSKRGTRSTVGIPGTGLSFSKLSPSSKKSASPPSQNTNQASGSGCLGGIFRILALPFQLFFDLIRSIINPETRRSSLILLGILGGIFVSCFGILSIFDKTDTSRNRNQNLDLNIVATEAMLSAQAPYTLTAAYRTANAPTNTPLATMTPFATYTPLPTNTEIVLPTLAPTITPYIPPTLPSNCLPSYPDFCITRPRLTCDQLGRNNFTVFPPDPLGYDRDKDGIGCEG